MKTIETRAAITADGRLIVQVQAPDALPPGDHNVVVVIEDAVLPQPKRGPLDFPVIDVGPWPQGLSLRREDMYDNWGR